jgi:hypothetical protein
MKVVPVTRSFSEDKTFRILDSVLPKRGYKILAAVRLQDALQAEANDQIDTPEETTYYRRAHFDFVVCQQVDRFALMPIFAVEFDGPQHDVDSAQKRRDQLKNRFCKDAHFPLLRITSEQLEQHERVSLLAFMLERFLAWQRESHNIWEDCRQRFEQLPPDDPVLLEMNETGSLDPAFDPMFLFNLEHPFPAILTVLQRLARRGIFSARTYELKRSYIRQHRPKFVHAVHYPLHSFGPDAERPGRWSSTTVMHLCREKCVDGRTTLSEDRQGVASQPPGVVEAVHSAKQTASLKWACATGRTLLQQGPFGGPVKDFLFCDLPGVHVPDVAEDLSEYLCLRDIEKWAGDNLPQLAAAPRPPSPRRS